MAESKQAFRRYPKSWEILFPLCGWVARSIQFLKCYLGNGCYVVRSGFLWRDIFSGGQTKITEHSKLN